jgi:hypothetical protein
LRRRGPRRTEAGETRAGHAEGFALLLLDVGQLNGLLPLELALREGRVQQDVGVQIERPVQLGGERGELNHGEIQIRNASRFAPNRCSSSLISSESRDFVPPGSTAVISIVAPSLAGSSAEYPAFTCIQKLTIGVSWRSARITFNPFDSVARWNLGSLASSGVAGPESSCDPPSTYRLEFRERVHFEDVHAIRQPCARHLLQVGLSRLPHPVQREFILFGVAGEHHALRQAVALAAEAADAFRAADQGGFVLHFDALQFRIRGTVLEEAREFLAHRASTFSTPAPGWANA